MLFKKNVFPLDMEHPLVGKLNIHNTSGNKTPVIHWNIACEHVRRKGYDIFLDSRVSVNHINHRKEGMKIIRKWNG